MRTKHLVLAAVGLALCSCSSIKHTSSTAAVETKVVNFTVADVEVQPAKISKTTSWSYNPFRRISVETVKTNTTALMLQEAGADVLLEPEYIVEKRGFLRGGSVTVIGFPASYSNFHKMTQEEAQVFKVANDNAPKKEKKRFFFF